MSEKKESKKNIFPKNFNVEGNIRFKNTLEIETKINSNIYGDILIIKENASLQSENIRIKTLYLKGNLYVKNLVVENKTYIFSKSNFKGNINAKTIFVEKGAKLDGFLNIKKDKGGSDEKISSKNKKN